VVGKKRSEEDAFSSNLSFLTSDSEEFDDQVQNSRHLLYLNRSVTK